MERGLMGLNVKDSVIVVKEETPEDFKDSGSAFPWPLPSKVSAVPHFMSYKAAQVEKKSNVIADHVASSGLITEPAVDPSLKCQSGELHISTNFAGATSKQLYFGGVPVSFPHSVLPTSNFVAGTTESWFNTKATPLATEMTIFYAGSVNVFDAITPEKAQAIMFLAGYGCLSPSISQTKLQLQAPPAKPVAGDAAFSNHGTPPSSALSSPISVSSHPDGTMGCGATYSDELKAPKNTGISIKAEPSNMMASITAVAASSAVPQFRKASLARFLQKRKERVMNSAPYNLSKKSAAEEPHTAAGSMLSS